MPLYKTINFNDETKILIWQITETFEDLFDQVALSDVNTIRVFSMKSQQHQRGFLSVRKLLQEAGYRDTDLYYDEFGKPHLNDGCHISVSHSHDFSAIIISHKHVGIDFELRREKIINIDFKFAEYELQYLNKEDRFDYISRLTVIWGVKEAIFKIRNEKGISFKDHIKVTDFKMEDKKTRAWLHFEDVIQDFLIYFDEIENYTLVYAFENI